MSFCAVTGVGTTGRRVVVVRRKVKVTRARLALRNKVLLQELYWKAGFVWIREVASYLNTASLNKRNSRSMQMPGQLWCNMIMTLYSYLGT